MLAAAFVLCAAAQADPAAAQVIDISPSGETTTYDRPMIFTADGPEEIAGGETAATPVAYHLGQLIQDAAARQRLSPDLLLEVARRESGFRQTAVSNKGAVGLMQLTAGTARDLGVDRFDARQNMHGGAAYLRNMLDRYGDLRLALAAYNAGPGAVDRYGGVPPFAETKAYVAAIMTRVAARAVTLTPAIYIK